MFLDAKILNSVCSCCQMLSFRVRSLMSIRVGLLMLTPSFRWGYLVTVVLHTGFCAGPLIYSWDSGDNSSCPSRLIVDPHVGPCESCQLVW